MHYSKEKFIYTPFVLAALVVTGLGWGWFKIDSINPQMGPIQGQVNAVIDTNGHVDRLSQELRPVSPGVMGADVTLDQQVNGAHIHAGSSSTVFTSFQSNE